MTRDVTGEIHVRRAVNGDLDTIVEFNSAMALESEGVALDHEVLRLGVQAMLKKGGRGIYYVAEVSGRVVGQLAITTEWSDWRNGYFWWVQSVYSHPDYRRRGIYRALHRHVEAEAKDQGDVRGIKLYVDRDNRRAKEVYASLGMAHSHYDLWEVDLSA